MFIVRRAKPLLGTLVEIGIDQFCEVPSDPSQVRLHADTVAATELAFAGVAQVHALMSRHEPSSDLSRFNQASLSTWVEVAPQTLAVFSFAQQLSQASLGLFDVCASRYRDKPGRWQSIEIDLQRGAICKHAPLLADLGGIAKGYAVDVAVAALQQAGIQQGWVNAGGDLRVFGEMRLPLHVRSPRKPAKIFTCTQICKQAAATSALHFDVETASSGRADGVTDQVRLQHGVTQSPVATPGSWTVVAPTCMVADALTKLVAISGDAQLPLLAKYNASAWIYN